jgi:hypothetical protein
MLTMNQIKQSILLAMLRTERAGDSLLVDSILLRMADYGVLPQLVMVALGDMLTCGLVGPGLRGEVVLTDEGQYWAEQVERAVTDGAALEAEGSLS